jgi:hypothetical protein
MDMMFSKYRFKWLKCGILAAAIFLLSMVEAGCQAQEHKDQAREHWDAYARMLQDRWKNIPLSRNMAYWQAPECSPGPFLCQAPAATEVWVSNDRWPDGSDARRFGRDAIRISGAKTEH